MDESDEYDFGVPDNAAAIHTAVARALKGVTLSDDEYTKIASYLNREVEDVMLNSAVTSYLLLGSYHDPYMRRLRTAQHELTNRRTDTRAVIVGDTSSVGLREGLPDFPVKFHLLATTADHIAMVIEKDSKGENDELGKITAVYDEKSHLFPRDFTGLDPEPTDSKQAVMRAAIEVYYNGELDDEQKESTLRDLLQAAQEAAIEITAEEVRSLLEARDGMAPAGEPTPAAEYAWPQTSDFQVFQEVGRCYPWFTPLGLRDNIQKLPL